MGESKTCNFFVAVITDKFLARTKEYLGHCFNAEKENKPMYAVVKNGVNWDDFKPFSWRNIYFFDTEKEYDIAWKEIKKDIKFYKLVQTYGP